MDTEDVGTSYSFDLNCIQETGGIGISKSTYPCGLVYTCTETKTDLSERLRFFGIRQPVKSLFLKQTLQKIRYGTQYDLVTEGG